MKNATLKQAAKILDLVKDVPCEQVQEIISSGLLSDLLHANTAVINRDKFREIIGFNKMPSQEIVETKMSCCDSCGQVLENNKCTHLGCPKNCRDFFGGCNFNSGKTGFLSFLGYTGRCVRCGSFDPKGDSV